MSDFEYSPIRNCSSSAVCNQRSKRESRKLAFRNRFYHWWGPFHVQASMKKIRNRVYFFISRSAKTTEMTTSSSPWRSLLSSLLSSCVSKNIRNKIFQKNTFTNIFFHNKGALNKEKKESLYYCQYAPSPISFYTYPYHTSPWEDWRGVLVNRISLERQYI